MNLYELVPQIREIEARIDENPEEQLFELLDELQKSGVEVAGNVVRWIENVEAYAEALKAEKDKLAAKQKSAESKAERLREYLLGFMQATDTKKITTDIRTISRRAASTQTVVDESKVLEWPEEIVQRCVTYKAIVNKPELKRCPGFEKLPGVTEIEGKESISIR
jgi:arginine repressor